MQRTNFCPYKMRSKTIFFRFFLVYNLEYNKIIDGKKVKGSNMKNLKANCVSKTSVKGFEKARKIIKRNKGLYIMLIPAVVWCFIFQYIPLYGITLAFKDFNYAKGLFGSDWAGFTYFKQFLFDAQFWEMVKNTIIVSGLKLLICMPLPLIFALMLNEVAHKGSRRFMQTLSYLPHFVSWVVIIALLNKFVSPYGGVINQIREAFGLEPVYYMGEVKWFYPLVILTHSYKSVGWNSILYLSAMAGINQELYEAAHVDGAGCWRRIFSITLPSILPTIILVFIMNVGTLMTAGFDQMYLLSNPANESVSRVLDTYTVNIGIKQGKFSLATAVGLFLSLINLSILLVTNAISKKASEVSLF